MSLRRHHEFTKSVSAYQLLHNKHHDVCGWHKRTHWHRNFLYFLCSHTIFDKLSFLFCKRKKWDGWSHCPSSWLILLLQVRGVHYVYFHSFKRRDAIRCGNVQKLNCISWTRRPLTHFIVNKYNSRTYRTSEQCGI